MGRRLVRVIVASMVAASIVALPSVPSAAAPDPRDFPDPFVLPVDGGYLAVATSPHRGDLAVPLRRSADLATWTEPVEALARRASWASGAAIWAPAIFSPAPGKWRLYYAVPHLRTRLRCVSVASASRPEGPYFDDSVAPLTCDDRRGGAIDPEVFRDDEGRNWLVWKTEGRPDDLEAALWAQQLDADATGVLGNRTPLLERAREWERPLIENPSMVLNEGRWLLFYSAGVWQNDTYKVGVAHCHSPAGPCERVFDRPVLSSTGALSGPGGGSVFRDASGRLRLGFHAWHPDHVGYERGGARSLHVGAIRGDLGIGADPIGSLDTVQRPSPGRFHLRGWAADADTHAPVQVHVYAGGEGVAVVDAVAQRPDVESAHPGLGAHRGWEVVVEAPPAGAELCAYAINTGVGTNQLLGCRGSGR